MEIRLRLLPLSCSSLKKVGSICLQGPSEKGRMGAEFGSEENLMGVDQVVRTLN